MLKRSGIVENLPNGVAIIFRASYASEVEHGRPERPVTGSQTVHIKEHIRRAKDGKAIRVKAHDVTYENKKLIGFRPKITKFERGEKIYRVISIEKATVGQYYLSRAKDKELPNLGEDVNFYLKRLEKEIGK